METILFEANFNSNDLSSVLHQKLFEACNKLNLDYTFAGISYKNRQTRKSANVDITNIPFNIGDNIFSNILLPIIISFNKNIPVYFPNGKVCNFIPKSNPVITFFRKSLDDFTGNDEQTKKIKRNIQTDINRSDITFVSSEQIQKQYIKEFNLAYEPVILPLAPLVEEQNELELCNQTNENYFLIPVENISEPELSEVLKIFIYLHTTNKSNIKLYLIGEKNFSSQELLINISIAKQIGFLSEYKNVSFSKRTELLKNAIAILSFSNIDTLPLLHLDAMKCGCPIITTKSNGFSQYCADAVIYANPDNNNEYTQIIEQISTNIDIRNILINKGFEQQKKFDWEKSAKIFINNIENLYLT